VLLQSLTNQSAVIFFSVRQLAIYPHGLFPSENIFYDFAVMSFYTFIWLKEEKYAWMKVIEMLYGESFPLSSMGVISLLLIFVLIFHSLCFFLILGCLSVCFICNRCDWWYEESNNGKFHLHSLFLLSEIVKFMLEDTIILKR